MACNKCKMTDYIRKPKVQGAFIFALSMLFFSIVGLVTSFNYVVDLVSNLF